MKRKMKKNPQYFNSYPKHFDRFTTMFCEDTKFYLLAKNQILTK